MRTRTLARLGRAIGSGEGIIALKAPARAEDAAVEAEDTDSKAFAKTFTLKPMG
jgi:hypothetical protein